MTLREVSPLENEFLNALSRYKTASAAVVEAQRELRAASSDLEKHLGNLNVPSIELVRYLQKADPQ